MPENLGKVNILSQDLNQITERIIGCAFTVSNTLGSGFLEKVYENALAHELQKCGLSVIQQQPIAVYYDGIVAGSFYADILVDQTVLVELKCVRALDETHAAQCLNYLKATGLEVCLLLNFGKPKIEIRRFINLHPKLISE